MITLYLARHGQTVENLSRIFQGHLPGTLTEEGKKQAMELGESLRNIALDAVVSSDLQRVVDTVQLAVGDRQLPVIMLPQIVQESTGPVVHHLASFHSSRRIA